MRKEVINQKTKRLLDDLVIKGVVDDFYLAGGTALSLQFGHRRSIDLDWFNAEKFNTRKLREQLLEIGGINVESEEENTLNLILSGVKLSFLRYHYQLLFPLINWQDAKLADWRDIACMKLDAISSRGSKKDFIDLYFTLKRISFDELWKLFEKKYKDIKFNKLHILKSINYFDDAEKEPAPMMLEEIDWEKIKKYFINLTKNAF